MYLMYLNEEEIKRGKVNPISILWDLCKTPEEERITMAHWWDYCEETVNPFPNEEFLTEHDRFAKENYGKR